MAYSHKSSIKLLNVKKKMEIDLFRFNGKGRRGIAEKYNKKNNNRFIHRIPVVELRERISEQLDWSPAMV